LNSDLYSVNEGTIGYEPEGYKITKFSIISGKMLPIGITVQNNDLSTGYPPSSPNSSSPHSLAQNPP
jgi:hypothetical protein